MSPFSQSHRHKCIPVSSIPMKRMRDPLKSNRHEERYGERSQKRDYFVNRQRPEAPSPAKDCNVKPPAPSPRKPVVGFNPPRPRRKDSRLTGVAAADRRIAIKHVFQNVLGSPPRSEWEAKKTVQDIIDTLRMPRGSWGVVQSVIRALDADPTFDVGREAPGKGRRAEIEDFTDQAEFIYNALEKGNSIGTVTFLLNNVFRRKDRLRNLSYSTVARFVHQSPVIVIARRKSKKSGTSDPDALWSRARSAFAKQVLEQIELSGLSESARAARNSPFPPLYLHAIAWWDEHHKKVMLGFTSDLEARVYRDSSGKASLADDGGVLPPEKPKTLVKFPGEARMLFGVAMIKGADGRCHGVKAEPFSNTGCQVVGIKAFDKACESERRRCMNELQKPYDTKKVYKGAAYAREMRVRMRSGKHRIICV